MSPVSILNVVVFPAPFTPSRPKHCRWRGEEKIKQQIKSYPTVYCWEQLFGTDLKKARHTSPGETPTQIRSTAGIIVPLYVWSDNNEMNPDLFSFQSLYFCLKLIYWNLSPWTGLLYVKYQMYFYSCGFAPFPPPRLYLPPAYEALGYLKSYNYNK